MLYACNIFAEVAKNKIAQLIHLYIKNFKQNYKLDFFYEDHILKRRFL